MSTDNVNQSNIEQQSKPYSHILSMILVMSISIFCGYKYGTYQNLNTVKTQSNINDTDIANHIKDLTNKYVSVDKFVDHLKHSNNDIEKIIAQYLNKHPEVILEALENMQKKKNIAMEEEQQKKIQDKALEIQEIQNSQYSFIGNKNGDVQIVLFFDYRCGYCRQMNHVFDKLLEVDKNIKIVFQNYPITGSQSVKIAKIAQFVSIHYPTKFENVHHYLSSMDTNTTDQQISEYLKTQDIKFNITDITSNSVEEELVKTTNLAEYLNIHGAPAFIIGNKLYLGAHSLERVQQIIGKIRSKQLN